MLAPGLPIPYLLSDQLIGADKFLCFQTNGTFTRGTSQVLEMLLTDDLTFKVLSEGQSELRGRVKQRLYSDAFLGGETIPPIWNRVVS